MRNRSIQRLICVFVVATILAGLLSSGLVSSTSNHQDPNIALLDAMLDGDRHWVIETIVNDDRSNNPYAKAYSSVSKSLMATVFSQLENKDDPDYRAAYSITMQALVHFYYEQKWADGLVDKLSSLVNEVLEFFGEDENGVLNFVDDLMQTTAELNYDSILAGVFTDTYTSSWGETADDQEAMLRQMTEISDATSNLSRLSASWAGTYLPGESEDSNLILQFNEGIVAPAVQYGSSFCRSIAQMTGGEKAASDEVVLAAQAYSSLKWVLNDSANCTDALSLVFDLKDALAGGNAVAVLEKVDQIASLNDTALAQHMFMHQLCAQSDLFYNTLMRVSDRAETDGFFTMHKMLESYANQMDDALYSDQMAYQVTLAQLAQYFESDSNEITVIIDLLENEDTRYDFIDALKTSSFTRISVALGIGMFLLDEALSLKETCLMLSEMQYLRDLINEVKKVYFADAQAYRNNKTSENARKVMSDLLLLQRLRLRGENLANGMVASQLNSPAGRLFSGCSFLDFVTEEESDLTEGWNAHYQRSIDCIIGATLNPYGSQPFRLSYGQKMIIYYSDEYDTYVGGLPGGNVLFEMQYRVMPGLIVEGGELSLTDGIAIPAIKVIHGGSLTLDASQCKIGALRQTGGTLTVRNANLNCGISLDLYGTTVNLNGYSISSPNMSLGGAVQFSNGPVLAGDLSLNNAAVGDVSIYCTGDLHAYGESAVENLILNGTEKQTITGAFGVRNLTMNNSRTDGICSDGQILVTGLLSDPTNDDPGGILLYETADISGSQVASDLTLLGADISHAVHYLGNVTATGDASTSGGHIEGFLLPHDGSFTNRSSALTVEEPLRATGVSLVVAAPITVNGDARFGSTAFSGGSALSIRGNADFTSGNTSDAGTVIVLYGDCTSDPDAASNGLGTVRLAGTGAQNFDFTGSVANLNVVNTGLLGVNVTGTATITNSFTGQDQRVRKGERLILTGNSFAELENLQTDLTICDWHGSRIDGLVGTLYARGDNRFTSDMAFGGGLRQTGGSIFIEDAAISFRESLECGGNWSIDAYSSLVTSQDAGFTAKVVNNGLLKAEDVQLSGTMTGSGILEVSGDLTSDTKNHLAQLLLSGHSRQNISGKAITVDALTAANTTLQGICFESPVYVTQTLTAAEQRLRSGENLILTGTSSAFLDKVTGNLRIEDWAGTTLTGLVGTLYASGDNTITSEVELGGGLRQESGTITIDGGTLACQEDMECSGSLTIREGGTLRSDGDGAFQGAVVNDGTLKAHSLRLSGALTGTGTLELAGDLTAENAAVGTLQFSGAGAQVVSGGSITADSVIAANTTLQGIRFDSPVYVTGSFTAENQRLRSGENLILTGTSSAFLDKVTGNLHIENWNGTILSGLVGTLYATGKNVITSDLELRGGIRQEGGTVTIDGGTVTCQESLECAGDWVIAGDGALSFTGDGIFLGNVTNDGTLKGGSLQLDGALSGTGTLELTGDLATKKAGTVGTLRFTGAVGQTVSGSDLTVTNLHNQNTTGWGVLMQSRVYVTGVMENNGRLRGIQPLQVTDGAIFTADTTTAALSPDGDVVVGADVTLTVNGDLNLSGQLVLESGARLIVRGDLVGTGSTVTVAEGAAVTVHGNLRLTTPAVTLNGALLVWNDTILSGGTVQGTGTLELRGDLRSTAAVSGLDTLRLSGRVPQHITGNDIHVAHAVAANTASGGLEMDMTVYYSDTLTIEPGCKVSENYFVEE